MAPQPLPDWQTDWLYALVLQRAEGYLDRCNIDPDRDAWKYVLIEEYPEAQGSRCQGDVVRAWVRDESGLREIALEEDAQLTFELEQYSIYPFILVMFHILPDRRRVVFGFMQGSRGGAGWRDLVQGEGEEATLDSDPSGGLWMS
jgi:hypothetical protein